MKKNINVIQIKGIRGILMAGLIVSCLGAGFIVFPGWVIMHLWNYLSEFSFTIPSIGLIQGILLWAILVVSYMIFRKEKVVICTRAPRGLSEEELKAVFADMKRQSLEDPILQAMMKAKEAELKYKEQKDVEITTEQAESADNTKV